MKVVSDAGQWGLVEDPTVHFGHEHVARYP
jgi:hypothetical protein